MSIIFELLIVVCSPDSLKLGFMCTRTLEVAKLRFLIFALIINFPTYSLMASNKRLRFRNLTNCDCLCQLSAKCVERPIRSRSFISKTFYLQYLNIICFFSEIRGYFVIGTLGHTTDLLNALGR